MVPVWVGPGGPILGVYTLSPPNQAQKICTIVLLGFFFLVGKFLGLIITSNAKILSPYMLCFNGRTRIKTIIYAYTVSTFSYRKSLTGQVFQGR